MRKRLRRPSGQSQLFRAVSIAATASLLLLVTARSGPARPGKALPLLKIFLKQPLRRHPGSRACAVCWSATEATWSLSAITTGRGPRDRPTSSPHRRASFRPLWESPSRGAFWMVRASRFPPSFHNWLRFRKKTATPGKRKLRWRTCSPCAPGWRRPATAIMGDGCAAGTGCSTFSAGRL